MPPAPPAGQGFSPLDDQLALTASRFSPQLREWIVRLASWLPFAPAAQMLSDFTGVLVDESTVRRQSEAAGARYVEAQEAEVRAIEQTLPDAPPAPPRLVMEADGAMVALQGGEWAEVRTLAIGDQPEARPQNPTPRTGALSYFSRLSDAASFERQSLSEVQRRGVERAGQIAAVADGAEWVQSLWAYHCPGAVRILDLAHVVEHLGVIGGAVWGEGSRASQVWVEGQAGWLKRRGPAWLLDEVRGLCREYPGNEVLRRELGYLEKRGAQMEYGQFRAAGWPLGSGVIESANKLVVEARLKGAGMRWGRGHVNAMLGLRNIVCNDRWAEGWGVMEGGARLRRVERQGAGSAARQEAGSGCSDGEQASSAAATRRLRAAHPPAAPAKRGKAEYARAGSTPTDGRETWRPADDHPWKQTIRQRSAA